MSVTKKDKGLQENKYNMYFMYTLGDVFNQLAFWSGESISRNVRLSVCLYVPPPPKYILLNHVDWILLVKECIPRVAKLRTPFWEG